MNLQTLIQGLPLEATAGDLNKTVERIDFDSRQVQAGSLFVAVRGRTVDGHQFIDKAIEKGATIIAGENRPHSLPPGITFLQVSDSATFLGLLADRFYDQPSRKIRLVGITGTNGKTTTVTLLYHLFTNLGYKCGLLSTIGNRIGDRLLPAGYTTPDAVSINALLAEMVAAGCEFAFMEVSSHAVDQRRISGLHFTGAIFSNITHDHLDYHGTFQAYLEAKKGFFDQLPPTAFALINVDDRRGEVMVQNTRARICRYSLRKMADFRAKVLENALSGLHLELDGQDFYSRLIGEFNAYNLLAVYATARLLGEPKMETLTALSELSAAEGRFDYLLDPDRRIIAIVDYAHTPDALEKVLQTIRQLKTEHARVITVVGCGGDRDKAKRPKMAQVACAFSEQVILTSDNPRSEEPEAILADMEAGLTPRDRTKTLTITDRRTAIQTACRLAHNGDVILVAGKGHEKYQEIKGVKYPFDDKEILKAEFSG